MDGKRFTYTQEDKPLNRQHLRHKIYKTLKLYTSTATMAAHLEVSPASKGHNCNSILRLALVFSKTDGSLMPVFNSPGWINIVRMWNTSLADGFVVYRVYCHHTTHTHPLATKLQINYSWWAKLAHRQNHSQSCQNNVAATCQSRYHENNPNHIHIKRVYSMP